jgi:hypothetical protein
MQKNIVKLWSLVLIAIIIAPYAIFRIRPYN